MILQIANSDPKATSSSATDKLKNMHLSDYPQMILFHTALDHVSDPTKIIVTFCPPGSQDAEAKNITVPLLPDVSNLASLDINMHNSPTKAYDMGVMYNDWFSACFGFQVILAYLSEHGRPVLGNLSPDIVTPTNGWLSGLTGPISILGSKTPVSKIGFSDCAPFLIASTASMASIRPRVPADEDFTIIKFRPNIVISGAEFAFEEDFWGKLALNGGEEQIDIELTANCARCRSINVDYATGQPGKGDAGKILKKLMSDRRVDKGVKYSPVFGRYGFLGIKGEGKDIAVGDDAVVTRRNAERTTFGKRPLFRSLV
jgi:uncharacterized protein YcbX